MPTRWPRAAAAPGGFYRGGGTPDLSVIDGRGQPFQKAVDDHRSNEPRPRTRVLLAQHGRVACNPCARRSSGSPATNPRTGGPGSPSWASLSMARSLASGQPKYRPATSLASPWRTRLSLIRSISIQRRLT
jgi:hypothetical protein